VLQAATAAETRGWAASQEKNRWYIDELAKHGIKVVPPGQVLTTGLKRVGEQLTAEWLRRTGDDGWAVIEGYKQK